MMSTGQLSETRADRRPTLVEALSRQRAGSVLKPRPTAQFHEPDLRGADLVVVPTTVDQFPALSGWFDVSRPKSGILYDWRPILLVRRDGGFGSAHIVGVHRDREEWVLTSRIDGALETLAVQSRSGIYGLGTQGFGDLSAAMCEIVRRTVQEFGIGREVTLPIDRYAAITRGRFPYEGEPNPIEGPRKSPSSVRTIDDLIRRNRHLVELAIATPEEIERVIGDVGFDARSRELTTWRLLAIRDPQTRMVDLRLLGTRLLRPCGWITSSVTALSLDRKLCRTSTELFALGQHLDEPLAPHELMVVATFLEESGLAEEFGLDAMLFEEIAGDTS